MQQLERRHVADRLGDLADRRRVGQVAPHGDVGQQQVVLHEPHQHVDVAGRETEARTDLADERHPRRGVIAGIALAEIVEQRPEHEEVGAVDAAGEGGGVGGRLPQVPVDGEAVVGVALRPAAHGIPLRQQPHEDAPLVERLEHVDRPMTLAEEGDELLQRPVRPALLPRGDVDACRQLVQRRAGQAHLALGSDARRPQHEHRVLGGIGTRAQLDLPVDDDEAVTDTLLVADLVPRRVAPRALGDPGDSACRRRDVRHQHVGGRCTAPVGDGLLVLEAQHVTGSAGRAVQGDTDSDERLLALVQCVLVVGRHEEVGLAGPPQRVDVAETAVTVLQIGLEEVGDVAGRDPPFDHPRAEGIEPATAVAAVLRRPLRRQPGAELVVAGERAGAEQRRRRVQVLGGEGELLVERAHGVAELEPGVPQRVPERGGDLVDAAGPPVVDEQHVDVALRGQLLAPVPADGDERDGRPAPPRHDPRRSLGEQPAQQLVGRVRQCTAQLPAAERAVGDQRVPLGGRRRRHPRRVGPIVIGCAGWSSIAAAVALLAACDGDGDDDGDAAAVETTPATTVTPTTEVPNDEDGVLRIGLLLPKSGEAAAIIGQPLIDAAVAAVDAVNAAGGVLGNPVELVTDFDEGSNAASAREAIAGLIDADVDAVVGPASSTIALATLGDLMSAGILTCSPTATALALDDFPDSDLFIRTAPSDSLQAAELAQEAEDTGATIRRRHVRRRPLWPGARRRRRSTPCAPAASPSTPRCRSPPRTSSLVDEAQ